MTNPLYSPDDEMVQCPKCETWFRAFEGFESGIVDGHVTLYCSEDCHDESEDCHE